MVVRNIDSSVIRHAQERIAAARLWIRMLLIIGFVVEFFSNLLEPRANFAGEMGVCDKTASRMNLPTTYLGGVAYVARNASLKIVAERVRRRNQPQQRRRGRR